MLTFDAMIYNHNDIVKCLLCIGFVVVCAILNQILMFVSAHKIIIEYNYSSPLPDYFLDCFEPIPNAYIIGCIFIWINSVIFLPIISNKRNGIILLKRLMCIFGAIFAMKLVTMISTTIGIPRGYENCVIQYKTHFDNITFTSIPWKTVMDTNVCGTFIISLPVAWIVLLTLFAYYYLPEDYRLIRPLFICSNIFSIVLLYISQRFFSIDVLIAVLIAKELFQKYHYIVGVMALKNFRFKPEAQNLVNRLTGRMKLWHPIYYIMES